VDREHSFADWGWRKIAGRDTAVTAPRVLMLLPPAGATDEPCHADPGRGVEITAIAAMP
jgi:hypothetical protein